MVNVKLRSISNFSNCVGLCSSPVKSVRSNANACTFTCMRLVYIHSTRRTGQMMVMLVGLSSIIMFHSWLPAEV